MPRGHVQESGPRQQAERSFAACFGRPPQASAFAPGRVELLGNHTDYNEGPVAAAALERGVGVAVASGEPGRVRLYAERFDERLEFPLAAAERAPGWAVYPQAVLGELARLEWAPPGLDAAIASDLASGAGLASSAAFEVAFAVACLALGDHALPPLELARLAQRAECDGVGVKCGLLDQAASVCSRADSVLFLDCRSLEYTTHPHGRPDLHIVVAETGVERRLVDSAYNARRADCEAAVELLAAESGRAVRALRDACSTDLARVERALGAECARRCRHVIEEIARVQAGARALERGDAATFGRLMFESHASSRDLYAVSCPELDALVESASRVEGVLGAKLTGAGFGGATVTLVAEAGLPELARALTRDYAEFCGREPVLHVSRFGPGALAVPRQGS